MGKKPSLDQIEQLVDELGADGKGQDVANAHGDATKDNRDPSKDQDASKHFGW